MSTLTEATAAIRSGPQGPQVAAVFDFGGTVVDELPRRGPLRRMTGRGDARRATLLGGIRRGGGDGDYGRFLQAVERTWAGAAEDELEQLGRSAFGREIYGRLFPEAWQLVREHQLAGHTVVLVSELTRFQVRPVADKLGIEHVLCTRLAAEDGVLTGHTDGVPLWRNGKAEAVREFAAAGGLEIGYVYADSATDQPLLDLADAPTVIDPDPALAALAADRDWPTLAFRPRRAPRPLDYLRTVAGFAALIGGAIVGILRKSYTGRRQAMADALMHDATTATLRSIGVQLRVVGAENARAPRPAVFLFNHQSQFDVIIVPKVLDGAVTGIGKKELANHPLFGPIMRFVGVTFIDRADTAGAKAALAPVVSTLRDGLSIGIAPEGTRSHTPGLGPFKKGAFHMAIKAGVPVIPVVIRNAGEIAWRDSPIARSGVVDVAVLAPIDVSDWDPADLDERVEQVRQLFEHTILNWPQPD
ncbi:acyl-phosphate glycerol 3-phosphate acyltransferase [Nocardia mangyaensis]|uniref:1-acyl-sn-glycerol-3-phosphate acyltransferase n=1 Tax=Nocardia mangyaensis TaxID=2213200 RepID=A0A1J0VM52_9NOCA|nr:1-acylglycerol-3-phosphate O-acyltransferase [Nocardia mangyaensis]APE33094.1 acyl-phosphate glycerol 3-phosphate acyltransferase [Nocardia mangyaensis]